VLFEKLAELIGQCKIINVTGIQVNIDSSTVCMRRLCSNPRCSIDFATHLFDPWNFGSELMHDVFHMGFATAALNHYTVYLSHKILLLLIVSIQLALNFLTIRTSSSPAA
jgi:hypothetical protein